MQSNQALLTTSQSTENNLAKVWVAATGSQLDHTSFEWLFGLYRQGTDYQVISAELETHMNGLLSINNGNLVKTVGDLIVNGTGTARSDAEVQALINTYTSEKGIDTWTKLFAYWITNPEDEIGAQLEDNVLTKLIAFGVTPPAPETGSPIVNPEVPIYENPLPTDKYIPGDAQDLYIVPKEHTDNWGVNTSFDSIFIDGAPLVSLFSKIGNKTYTPPSTYVQKTEYGKNIVLDFGGGAKTAVFDYYSARVFADNFVYLWNFNSDDKIIFVNDTALNRVTDHVLNRFYPTVKDSYVEEAGYIMKDFFDDPLLDGGVFVDNTPLDGYGVPHEYGGKSMYGFTYSLILDQSYTGFASSTGGVRVVGVSTNDFVELSPSNVLILS